MADQYRHTFPVKGPRNTITSKKQAPAAPRPLPMRFPSDPLAQLDPRQVAALANLQVNNQMAPQRAEIARQRQVENQRALDRAKIIEGFAKAQAELAGGAAPMIRDVYQGAAQTQGALGQGYSGTLKDTLAGVAGANPDAAANTASYLGGYIPGTNLNEEGASSAARAALLPNEAMGAGRLQLRDAQYAAEQKDNEYAQALIDLAKKRPELHDAVMQQLQQNEISKANMRIQRGYLRLQTAKSLQDQAAGLTDVTGTLHVVRGGKVVDTGQPVTGTSAYRNSTNPSTTAGKAKANHAKIVAAMNDDVAKATSDIAKTAVKFVHRAKNPAYDERRARILGDAYKTPPTLVTKEAYGKARQQLWNQYGQPLMRYASGAGRAKLRARIFKIIDQALATQGITPTKKAKKTLPASPGRANPDYIPR